MVAGLPPAPEAGLAHGMWRGTRERGQHLDPGAHPRRPGGRDWLSSPCRWHPGQTNDYGPS